MLDKTILKMTSSNILMKKWVYWKNLDDMKKVIVWLIIY